jgi:hypothetical protein
MLLLVLALHAASVAAPPPEPQRTHQKRTARKARKARRTRVATPRMNILAPACRTPTIGCTRDRNAKYRVAGSREEYDPKARALEGPFANCGVTGMPVCPSNGQTILTSKPD